MIVQEFTPVKKYELRGVPVWVKREDLCCPKPGPSFSKVRGVLAHIQKRPEQTIGVLDTRHSKAGWGVSYVCQKLGRKVINFWPRYKADPKTGLPRKPQRMAKKLGAQMVALKAGRSAILYHEARKQLAELEPDSYLMPNALKLAESVQENAKEVRRTILPTGFRTVVISISSGTIAAGVLRGLKLSDHYDYVAVLHMGYSRSKKSVQKYVEDASGFAWEQKGLGLACGLDAKVELVDENYSYSDTARKGVKCPFPCNPYYDLKAWRWLDRNIKKVPGPVVFWNIGA